MKILLNGIQSNLRFSSAHVIPGHESCGFIHGHSYFVDVEIEGERAGEFQFVVDFKDVKKYTKAIANIEGAVSRALQLNPVFRLCPGRGCPVDFPYLLLSGSG